MLRLQRLLAAFLPALSAALPVAGVASPLGVASALTAGLAVVLLVGAAVVALEPTAAPARVRAVSLRERARHSVYLRLRDPDAPGRTRSRAPSCSTAA